MNHTIRNLYTGTQKSRRTSALLVILTASTLGTVEARDSAPFFVQHTGGMYMHPKGGGAVELDTGMLLYSGENWNSVVYLRPQEGKWGHLIISNNHGYCLMPYGEQLSPAEGTQVVSSHRCGSKSAHWSLNAEEGTIQHRSGLYVGTDGTQNPGNDTKLTLQKEKPVSSYGPLFKFINSNTPLSTAQLYSKPSEKPTKIVLSGTWDRVAECRGSQCGELEYSMEVGVEKGKEVGNSTTTGKAISLMAGGSATTNSGSMPGGGATVEWSVTGTFSKDRTKSISESFTTTMSRSQSVKCAAESALWQWVSKVKVYSGAGEKVTIAKSKIYVCTNLAAKPPRVNDNSWNGSGGAAPVKTPLTQNPTAVASGRGFVSMDIQGNSLQLNWTKHENSQFGGPRRLAYWAPSGGNSSIQIVKEKGQSYIRMNAQGTTMELNWASHDKANLSGPRRLAMWTPNTGHAPIQIVQQNGQSFVRYEIKGKMMELNWTSHDKGALGGNNRLAYWTPILGKAPVQISE